MFVAIFYFGCFLKSAYLKIQGLINSLMNFLFLRRAFPVSSGTRLLLKEFL